MTCPLEPVPDVELEILASEALREGEQQMSRKRVSVEQIINHLREAEMLLVQGQTVGEICRGIGVSEQSFYRWRREHGGLKIDQARRLKDLEEEYSRLKRAVADLTLGKLILREAAKETGKP